MLDSRVSTDGFSIRRRRECPKCEGRFSTVETMELLNITVRKRSGEEQPYQRDKIVAGLRRALEKRPVDDECLQETVYEIERDIQRLRKDVVETKEIGEIVIKHLRSLDEVAYLRFASVYRSFGDLETFREELIKLLPSKKTTK